MILEFYKYQATGNDFIIIDDREELFDANDSALIKALCQRSFGIGANGLILLRDDKDHDFRMIYFNSDGFESSLCGNGARCIVKFAHLLEISSENVNFISSVGVHQARITESDVSIKFVDINDIKKYDNDLVIDSGSPHYVTFSENIDQIDINLEGSNIRNSTPFKKKGINVNFLQVDGSVKMRTYERGVESETLSCGTGAVASAIALFHEQITNENIIELNTRGGVLTVSFDNFKNEYKNIWLTGEANLVYIGEFEC
jgi:diaminopimelate epimerase